MPIQPQNARFFMFGELAACVVPLMLVGLAIIVTFCRPGMRKPARHQSASVS